MKLLNTPPAGYKSIMVMLMATFLFLTTQAQQATKKYTIEQFYKTINFGGGTFHPKENKILLHDNSTGIYNVYELDLATNVKKPLTKSTKESLFSIDYIPGSNQFLYGADQGGNENTHIYLMADDGKVKDLTPGKDE